MKVFRKQRQRLAADNSVVKYLRYALGEIILVVIGILIALQVNNWNATIHTNIKNTRNLLSFEGELKSNELILRNNMIIVKKQMSTTLDMADSLNNNSVTPDKQDAYLINWFNKLGPIRTESMITPALNELVNSGAYNDLKSNSIKTNVLLYQANINRIDIRLNRFHAYFQDMELPYLTKHFSLLDMWKNGGMNIKTEEKRLGYEIPDLAQKENYFKSDRAAFFGNREFTSMLISRYFDLRSVLAAMDRLQQSIQRLLKEIKTVTNNSNHAQNLPQHP